jgi:hypothetical protein
MDSKSEEKVGGPMNRKTTLDTKAGAATQPLLGMVLVVLVLIVVVLARVLGQGP